MADTRSDERTAFLSGIAANPADYTRRKAYADWLDERGERDDAEFWRACESKFFSGLDLGQSADYSALVVLERHTIPNLDRPGSRQHAFDVRHLHRWPLKTPYPDVVRDVKQMFAAHPLQRGTLAVDETGVGRPVVDMFRQAKIEATLRPFTITCGSAVTGHTVAKKHLVGAVQAPLCSGRLRFAAGLALTPVLTKELEMFRVTVDESTRNESFAAWRNADHDDLVLALALALHVASVADVHAAWAVMG